MVVSLRQLDNYSAKCKQTLVDVTSLFQTQALRSRMANALRASKINQVLVESRFWVINAPTVKITRI